ncbi:MAG: hypothetical protein PHQ04_04520 [Opitutaceae bacterium]|nr:hypothetical protein [Opitutaceae bacterium]
MKTPNKMVRCLTLVLGGAVALCGASPLAKAKNADPKRAAELEARGRQSHYPANKFNLGDLPPYQPGSPVSGPIRMWGANYLSDARVIEYWESDFLRHHPGVSFEYHLASTEHAIPSLCFGVSDISPMTRPILWTERLQFQRTFNHQPLDVVVATGSFDVIGWNAAIGIYVHDGNPLARLTMKQVDGIFGAERTGGWSEFTWDPGLARGPESNIRTWGQLGMTGEWADKPIRVYGYSLESYSAREFEKMVFHGARKWNEHILEYGAKAVAKGTVSHSPRSIIEDLLQDRFGIGYAQGLRRPETPGLKAIDLAPTPDGPYYAFAIENVRNRTYPIFSEISMLLNRDPARPLEHRLKEYLRYLLSRDGQVQVMRDGKYLPLTAEVVFEQLRKLE